MDYYKRAQELKEEITLHRRYLHKNAEVGLDMPMARSYVLKELQACGIEASECGYGAVATLGKSGKVILLRADMDALPMEEESGETFASVNAGTAHTCGHDLHAAMLLTAAKMLKENEDSLKGTVKLMFQPAEETLEGAKHMIQNDVLKNPNVDVALAYHVAAGRLPEALFMYNNTGTMMYSADMFKIRIIGKGTHGAYPYAGIDPINIGNHICLKLQSLAANEASEDVGCLITIGHFEAGTTGNVIPDEALIEGSVRAKSRDLQKRLVEEIEESAHQIAESFGGNVEFELGAGVPPLICDPNFTEKVVGYMAELEIPNMTSHKDISSTASEDFAYIAEKVPSTFVYLSAGFTDERGDAIAHNPKVLFNENVLPIGSACLAHCATRWLEDN